MSRDLQLFINNSFYENRERKPFQYKKGPTPHKYNKIRKKKKISKLSKKRNRR